jgi:hypothetical protein
VIEETHHYLSAHWEKLQLGPGDPLIPGEVITEPPSPGTVYAWFRKAARRAAVVGKPLGTMTDDAYHGLRYNRRTELFEVSVKYARWLGEHSVLTGTPGITVGEGVYQGLVPQELVRAVQIEAPRWDAE